MHGSQNCFRLYALQDLRFDVRAAKMDCAGKTSDNWLWMHDKVFYVVTDFITTLHPAKTQAYDIVNTYVKRNPSLAFHQSIRAQPKLPAKGAKPAVCGTLDFVLCVIKEAMKRWEKTSEVMAFVSELEKQNMFRGVEGQKLFRVSDASGKPQEMIDLTILWNFDMLVSQKSREAFFS